MRSRRATRTTPAAPRALTQRPMSRLHAALGGLLVLAVPLAVIRLGLALLHHWQTSTYQLIFVVEHQEPQGWTAVSTVPFPPSPGPLPVRLTPSPVRGVPGQSAFVVVIPSRSEYGWPLPFHTTSRLDALQVDMPSSKAPALQYVQNQIAQGQYAWDPRLAASTSISTFSARGLIADGATALVLLAGCLATIYAAERLRKAIRARRHDPSRCIACGYSLVGLHSAICPECGAVNISPPQLRPLTSLLDA